jgi:hypothetical protein
MGVPVSNFFGQSHLHFSRSFLDSQARMQSISEWLKSIGVEQCSIRARIWEFATHSPHLDN